MTPLEMTAKASRNMETAKTLGATWVVLHRGVAMYEMESECVARAFVAGMGKQYSVLPAAKAFVQ